MFFKEPEENCAIVEVPGLEFPLRQPLFLQRETKLEAIERENIEKGFFVKDENVHYRLQPKYHLYSMGLKHPEQRKFLDTTISEKIARAIHERLSASGASKR